MVDNAFHESVTDHPFACALRWRLNVALEPSAVSNLSVAENGSCLSVDWEVPLNSGADSFVVRYRQIDAKSDITVCGPDALQKFERLHSMF